MKDKIYCYTLQGVKRLVSGTRLALKRKRVLQARAGRVRDLMGAITTNQVKWILGGSLGQKYIDVLKRART